MRVFLRMWRDECGRDKFKWYHEHPQDFAICFWQKNPKVSKYWIAYRVFIVLYFSMSIFVVIIIRATEDAPWYKNVIFFYYWVDFTEIVTFALGLAISVQRYIEEKKNPHLPPLEKMPFLYQAMWFFYVAAAPCAAVITISFSFYVQEVEDYPYLKYALVTHISNSICFVIDYSICAVPFRLLHFYLPVSFAAMYILFSVIYQSSGGTGNQGKIPITNSLDWRKPELALATCGKHIMCLIVAYTIFWVMKELKTWAKARREAAHVDPEA